MAYAGEKLPAYAGETMSQSPFYARNEGLDVVSLTPTPNYSGSESRYWFFVDRKYIAGPLTACYYEWNANVPVRSSIVFLEKPVDVDESDGYRLIPSIDLHVSLTWDDTAGADHYLLARRESAGAYDWDAPLVRLYPDQELADEDVPGDGAWVYRVRAYDAAGNYSESDEESATLDPAPLPPTDVTLTVLDAATIRVSWTASASADIVSYGLFGGIGSTGVDLSQGAVVTTSANYYDLSAPVLQAFWGEGHFCGLVRGSDGTNYERGLTPIWRVDIAANEFVLRPNPVSDLSAEPGASASATVTGYYDRTGELGTATKVNLYGNDGAGGAVNYAAILDTVALETEATIQKFELDSGALVGSLTYIFGVKAATAGDAESARALEIACDTDDTAPASPDLDLESD